MPSHTGVRTEMVGSDVAVSVSCRAAAAMPDAEDPNVPGSAKVALNRARMVYIGLDAQPGTGMKYKRTAPGWTVA